MTNRSIRDWCDEIKAWREDQGFMSPDRIFGPIPEWMTDDPPDVGMADLMLSKLMLVTTEIAEAAEAVRHGDEPNFREELADAVIRIMDIAGTGGWDLEAEIAAKMGRDRRRPSKHGKAA